MCNDVDKLPTPVMIFTLNTSQSEQGPPTTRDTAVYFLRCTFVRSKATAVAAAQDKIGQNPQHHHIVLIKDLCIVDLPSSRYDQPLKRQYASSSCCGAASD